MFRWIFIKLKYVLYRSNQLGFFGFNLSVMASFASLLLLSSCYSISWSSPIISVSLPKGYLDWMRSSPLGLSFQPASTDTLQEIDTEEPRLLLTITDLKVETPELMLTISN